MTPEEIKAEIARVGKIRRWYQPVPFGAIVPPTHWDDGKTHSNCFGNGRYEQYIRPALLGIKKSLPIESFTEIGCSAGLYLLRGLADLQLARIVGVEAGLGAFEQLKLVKRFYPDIPLLIYNNRIGEAEPNIKEGAGPPLDFSKLPITDIVMFCCSHYHMEKVAVHEAISKLSRKAMRLVIVTDEGATGTVISPKSSDITTLVNDWKFDFAIKTPKEKLALSGYKNLTANVYKSKHLYRLNVQECFEKQIHASQYNYEFYTRVFPDFIEQVNLWEEAILRDGIETTEVYEWQNQPKHGSTPWPPNIAKERAISYLNLVKTIPEVGQLEPITLLKGNQDSWDGHHRIAILHELHKKYVYGAY